MKISDLFKSQQLFTPAKSQQAEEKKVLEEQNQAKPGVQAKAGEDSVSISPLARQFAQVSQILAEDELQDTQRVAELKAQVEAGQYSVPSRDIARSLADFARDEINE